MKKVNYSLYVVTDTGLANNRSLEEIVRLAIKGGATIVQYRDKESSHEEMILRAKRIRRVTKAADVPLIINDNVEVALQVGAEGVHVGKDDMPAAQARKLIGKNMILGVSVKTLGEARKAVADGANYLGVGTIFATKTKPDAGKPTGLAPLREITRSVKIPTVGIGGINTDNAGSIIACGATGIAVISAIFGAQDPETAARNLRTIVEETRREMQSSIINEFSLIQKIRQKIPINSKNVIKGIGDDSAVIKIAKNKYLLTTCDCQAEGVHFLKNKKPADVGRKAIAVNVSDIASMGGKPTFCLISLIIPKNISSKYIDNLYSGLIQECKNYGVEIIGGNISKGKQLIIDVFMMGQVSPSHLILRSNAKPGDKVLVTGSLGEGRLALELLLNPSVSVQKKIRKRLISKHSIPKARLEESKIIAKIAKATAMLDISDGLSTDAFNLCEQSQVGIKIYETFLPMSNDLIQVSKLFKKSAFDLALNGGDDYELLFTAPPDSVNKIVNEVFKKTGTKVSAIGEILPKEKGKRLVLKNGKEVLLKAKGWDHLKDSESSSE